MGPPRRHQYALSISPHPQTTTSRRVHLLPPTITPPSHPLQRRELLQRANSKWTPARSIEDMDNAGAAAAVVSVTNRGLWFGDKETARRIAREGANCLEHIATCPIA